MESYYGPPIYDMSATDLTRKWLREAYREEIENYMKQEPGDTARHEEEEEEEVLYDVMDYLYHLGTDPASQVIFSALQSPVITVLSRAQTTERTGQMRTYFWVT